MLSCNFDLRASISGLYGKLAKSISVYDKESVGELVGVQVGLVSQWE